ncbi:hypothetical protein Chor_003809 [Crotalus horridus]
MERKVLALQARKKRTKAKKEKAQRKDGQHPIYNLCILLPGLVYHLGFMALLKIVDPSSEVPSSMGVRASCRRFEQICNQIYWGGMIIKRKLIHCSNSASGYYL